MPDPIHVDAGVTVPPAAQEVRAVRSSGPGGQNVNKVATKIELRVDLARIEGIDSSIRSRLARLAGRRLDASGRLLVKSQRTRDQARNLEDARRKVRELIARAMTPKKRRIPTRPGAAVRERRLDQKRRRAVKKKDRRRPLPGSDF